MPRFRILVVSTVLLLALGADAGQEQPAAKDRHGDPLPPGAVCRLGTVRFRHESPIVFAAFLPDGKRVVSVSSDGVACAWEFPSGKPVRRLEAFPADERRKATGRFEADLVTGWSGRSVAVVNGATLSPNGKHLTVFCGDGFLRVWDWANARQLGKVADVRGSSSSTARLLYSDDDNSRPVYSPDGNTLILATRVLQLVDLTSGKEVGPGLGHTEALTAVWFTPDGKQILTKDARATRTWDAATGKSQGTVAAQLPATPSGLTVLSPDGRVGVAASTLTAAAVKAGKGSEAILFDTVTGKELSRITLEPEMGLPRFLRDRPPLLFAPDGKMLAVAGGEAQQKIHLYEVPSGKLLRTFDGGPAAPLPNLGGKGGGPGGKGGFAAFARRGMQSMLFSPDGKVLAFQAGPGAAVLVLDTATGKRLASLTPAAPTPVLQGAFAPDGRCLALKGTDGTVTLYELSTGRLRRTYGSAAIPPAAGKADRIADLLGGPFSRPALAEMGRADVAISPDGKLLALPGPGSSVQVWDVLTGKDVAAFTGHTGAVHALAFAPDGKTLASASHDTTALIWDVTRIARPAPPAAAVKPGDLETSWKALTAGDAAAAFEGMGQLVAAPQDAVACIKDHVKPAPHLDLKHVEALLKQVNDGRFKVRDRATAELLKLGDLLLPVLDRTLASNPASETRQRLEQLRGKLTDTVLQGERLRVVRAVEVLERIGTPEARQVLRALADGAPGALVTTGAQAALKRGAQAAAP